MPIKVGSIRSFRTRRGMVRLQVGETSTLMTPAKAREIAGFLYECAEIAQCDELLADLFLVDLEMSLDLFAPLLASFREHRATTLARDWQHDNGG